MNYLKFIAGNIIKTKKYIYHISYEKHTLEINENGIKTNIGFHYGGYAKHNYNADIEKLPPAIFALNLFKYETLIDPTRFLLGGIIWKINTSLIDNTWYEDLHFHSIKNNYNIVTFKDIPNFAITKIN